MAKQSHSRRDFRVRKLRPKLVQTKQGLALMCPFCNPTHPLHPNKPSPCGTTIEAVAVQVIFSSYHTRSKEIRCLKCQEIGGEMVQYMTGYVHLEDCKPDVKLMPETPQFSKFAKFVYHLPGWMRKMIEKKTGMAKKIQDINSDGEIAGRTLGFVFWKG